MRQTNALITGFFLIATLPVAAQLQVESGWATMTFAEDGQLASIISHEDPPHNILRHGINICLAVTENQEMAPQHIMIVDGIVHYDFGSQLGAVALRPSGHSWGFLLEVTAVRPPGPPEITVFRAPVNTQSEFFPHLGICRSDSRVFAMIPGPWAIGHTEVQAAYQYSFRCYARGGEHLVNTARVALIYCAPENFDESLEQARAALGYVPAAISPTPQAAGDAVYATGITADNIGAFIDYTKTLGAQTLFLSQRPWYGAGVGQSPWTHLPGGEDALGRMAARIAEAGLLPGLHVTLPPTFTRTINPDLPRHSPLELARPLNRLTRRIFTTAPPTDYPHDGGFLLIDGELLRYTHAYIAEPYGFGGVARGVEGTAPREHPTGSRVELVRPGGMPLFKPDATWLAAADEIARSCREMGFEAFSLAASPSVPREHLVTFLRTVTTEAKPTIVETDAFGADVWPLCNRALGAITAPRNVGAFGGPLPRAGRVQAAEGFTKILQAVHWSVYSNAPLAFFIAEEDLRQDRISDVARVLQQARRIDRAAIPAELLDIEKTWALVPFDSPAFLPAVAVEGLAGGLSAMILEGEGPPGAIYHHDSGEGFLALPLEGAVLTLTGTDRQAQQSEHGWVLPLGGPVVVHADGVSAERLQAAFSQARVMTAATVWFPARQFIQSVGEMALGSAHGVTPEGAFGDVVIPTAHENPAERRSYVEYAVEVPHPGTWHVWGRVWYKDTDTNSFWLGVGEDPAQAQVFGNAMVFGQWLWDGGVSVQVHDNVARFRIYLREGAPPPDGPRLDMLCLTDDASYKPADLDARLLGRVGQQ